MGQLSAPAVAVVVLFASVLQQAPPDAPPPLRIRHVNVVDAAIRSYRELKATQADAYDFSEGELNDAGYALIRQKKIAEAIALLELNAEMYPRSANVFDSLGEAHAAAGHRDLAIANYRKSLALDPKNPNAIEQLKKLGGA